LLLAGIDTSAGSLGDPVYLSDGTAGGYTLTKPTGTDKVQIVGRIAEAHASTGAIQFDLPGASAQIVHNHEDNAEGGQLADLDALASGGIAGTSELAGLTGLDAAGTSKTIPRGDHTHDVANIADLGYGIPLVIRCNAGAAATTAIFDANAPFKFRVLDFWAVRTEGANPGTVKLTDGTDDTVPDISQAASDTDIDRAAQIDDSKHEIAANGSLKIVTTGAGNAPICYVMIIRVA